MTDDIEHFRLRYMRGSWSDEVWLTFKGHPTDSAREAIVRALAEVGRSGDGDGSDLKLSPADVHTDETAWDTQFLLFEGSETLGDLRLMVGPDDSKVLLRQGSWGGGDGPEMFLWVLEDFASVAGTILEMYGAVEAMKAAGRAIERRRHRQTREDAQTWVRSGYGEVSEPLLSAVIREHSWPAKFAAKHFGLADGDTALLMKACDFTYDPATETYYWLGAYPYLS